MKGFLTEENGEPSSTRLAMFLCVVSGCAVALMGTYAAMKTGATINLTEVAFLSGALCGAGFTGKVMQKGKESPKQ